MRNVRNIFAGAALVAMSMATVASADVVMTLNHHFGAQPADGFLVATFQTQGNDVLLTMDTTNLNSTEKVGSWYFNFSPDGGTSFDATGLTFGNFSGLAVQPAVSTSSTQSLQADGDGKFNIQFSFDTSTDNAFYGGSTSSVLISSTSAIVESMFNFTSDTGGGQGIYTSAAHVQSTGGGGGSDWLGTGGDTPVIPLPLAAWGGLMLMGGMGFSRTIRRRMMA